MAKKKNITKDKIIELYMDEVLTQDELSKSVYAFAKKNNFDENDFYQHFNSFDVIDKSIFENFCVKTVELLEASEEYESYDTRNKLLAFNYTFFELLTANRSYVYLKLKGNEDKLGSLMLLSELRKSYKHFVKKLSIQPIDFKNSRINELQDKGIEETTWIQLLVTIKFWLEDESKGFEKTDLFIEKSIKAQFDLIDTTPLKSVFDFAKFLWKEQV